MSVVAITPTGGRPKSLALLGEYLNNQTYRGPLQWIIVDDCDPGSPVPEVREGINVLRLRPSWRWSPGETTQAKCLYAGLARVKGGATVFILEDDDLYLPDYMDTMMAEDGELVGEKNSRYYNVETMRWRVLPAKYHSSMASTMFRGSAIHDLMALCTSGQKKMLDVTIWKRFSGSKVLIDAANVIGIKGLPGRPGIGVGHRRNFGVADGGNKLREWAGEYADNYRVFGGAA